MTRTGDRFRDRLEAGALLAEALGAYAGNPDAIALALPRGGVPVAFALAERLHIALDILIVRKLGVPGHEELAMGAVASGGLRVLNSALIDSLGLREADIETAARRELDEIRRRERLYRGSRPSPALAGRVVILVDDGLATGASMRVAVRAVRREHPARLIVAVPVGAAETCEALRAEADEVICLRTPPDFYAVGLWYQDFTQTSDLEVGRLLERSREIGVRV